MRVLRSGANSKLLFGLAALVLIGAIWLSFFRTPPESWQLLATGKLVKIEAEQAIYEKPNSPDYYLRVRITNLSSRFVGVEHYEKSHFAKGGMGEPFCFTSWLTEGNQLGMFNGLIPILWGSDVKTMEHLTLIKFRAGQLPRIAPGASQDFFLIEPNAKPQIARSWNSAPLWVKSKVFLPNDNLRSPYFIALLSGQLTATDGQSAQWFSLGHRNNYLALKYPIHTKTLL